MYKTEIYVNSYKIVFVQIYIHLNKYHSSLNCQLNITINIEINIVPSKIKLDSICTIYSSGQH